MKLFYDLRLGYLVATPGQDDRVDSLTFKAGDTEEILLQFGRSSDPQTSLSVLDAATWTTEQLTASSNITLAIKASGEYSDGTALASTSSYTWNATDELYEMELSLNTAAINTALGRNDANDENDIASLTGGFEVTFQNGGIGGWRSTLHPISATIYHDIISGSEGTPASASDPTEYSLKQDVIVWLRDANSLQGGAAIDLDAVVTTALSTGVAYALGDEDTDPNTFRIYKLFAGTDAESAPDVIRPDDFNASTNAKVWKLQKLATTGITELLEDLSPQLGGDLDANGHNIGFDDGDGITDDGGNEFVKFIKAASAVNEVSVGNAATGSSPTVAATGDDTDIDLELSGKGTGVVKVDGYQALNTADTTRAILAGQSGGQTLQGGTGASERLTLESTSNATKGGVRVATGDFLEIPTLSAAPGTPGSGFVRPYALSTGGFYYKDSGGNVYQLDDTSTRYKTIRLLPYAFSSFSGSPALAVVTFGASNPALNSWAFDDSSSEFISCGLTLPEDMDETVALRAKIRWSQIDSNTGTVLWRINGFNDSADGGTISTSALVSADIADASGGQYKAMYSAAATITDTSLAAGAFWWFNVGRLGASASDTKTGDVHILSVDIQYAVSDDTAGW